MTVVYSHYEDEAINGTGYVYFATLAEAKVSAQIAANASGSPVAIDRTRLRKVPLRQLAAALLNHEAWGEADDWEMVVKPQRGSKTEAELYMEENP